MPTTNEILAVALPLLVGAALLALATLVLRKGGAQVHTRIFGALYLFSGVKSLGDGLTADYTRADGSLGYVADQLHASSPFFPDTLTWQYTTFVCALAMLPLLFLFCATFPRPTTWMQRRPWLVAAVAFLPSAIVAVLLFSPILDPALLPEVLFDFNVVATLMTATAFLFLLRTWKRSPDHIERKQAHYVWLGFLPSFAATWAITFVLVAAKAQLIDGHGALEALHLVLRFGSPVVELAAAGLVAFAILKYNILGIDPKFRVGVKSGIVGFVFIVVFLVTQAIENIVLQGKVFAFAGQYGSFLLSGTTSIVLFKPIEKVSSKVSDRLMPRPAPGAPAFARAAEVYHAQCSYVLRDGSVSDREMMFLRNLRVQLGLNEGQARAIEETVERLLKVDALQTGATATTAMQHVAAAHDEVHGAEPDVRRATPAPVATPAGEAEAAPLVPGTPPST